MKPLNIKSDFLVKKINEANKIGLNRFIFLYNEYMYLCQLNKGVWEYPIKINVL